MNMNSDMNRGWHFKSTDVFGMVESGGRHFWFYQIKIWEYSMLFTKKKTHRQIILTWDTLPDLLSQKQRMEMADIYCRHMPLSNRKEAGMGSSGSFLQNLHGSSSYLALPPGFQPVMGWWPLAPRHGAWRILYEYVWDHTLLPIGSFLEPDNLQEEGQQSQLSSLL